MEGGFIERNEKKESDPTPEEVWFSYDQDRAEAAVSFADELYELKNAMVYEPDKMLSILKGEDKLSGAVVEIEAWDVQEKLTVIKVSVDGDIVYDAGKDQRTPH